MTLNAPHRYKVFSYFELAKISWILYLSFAAVLTADFIIAISLCWLLARHRTGFQRTDSIIRILMLYSVNTCVITTIFAFYCRITVNPSPHPFHPLSLTPKHPQFIKMPDNFVYIAFYFTIPKCTSPPSLSPSLHPSLSLFSTNAHARHIVFLNSLLVTLNTRKHVRKIGPSVSIPYSAISGTRTAASADSAGKSQYGDVHGEQVLQIQIQATKTHSVTNINV
ncbi:hypothetical protein A0H81_03488 [Grifola frondosa]|uniref:DUF6534 domain-containing protein n=1 Tax=Grifola frondosa TaxID=5627 RepID=A0A1C7MQ53_GRIFR|nr:hypothetical protein A0H81_03488 [Grifola frondosa]